MIYSPIKLIIMCQKLSKEELLQKLNLIPLRVVEFTQNEVEFLKFCSRHEDEEINKLADVKLEEIKRNLFDLDGDGLPPKNIDDLCRVVKYSLVIGVIFIVIILIVLF